MSCELRQIEAHVHCSPTSRVALDDVHLALRAPRVLLVQVHERTREVAHETVMESLTAFPDCDGEPDDRRPLGRAHAAAVHEDGEHFQALLIGKHVSHGNLAAVRRVGHASGASVERGLPVRCCSPLRLLPGRAFP